MPSPSGFRALNSMIHLVLCFNYYLLSKQTKFNNKIYGRYNVSSGSMHLPYRQITDAFDFKVSILRKTLQESVQMDLQNAAIQCGADLIVS